MKAGTGSARAVVGLGALVGLLLASGTAAARNVDSFAPSPGQDLVVGAPAPGPGAGAGVTLAPEAVPSKAPAPAPAVVPPVATKAQPTSTTTTGAPRTTTTAATPTTGLAPTPTTRPAATAAARATLSPASGPPLTQVTIKGGGCLSGDAGIAVTLKDPSGQGIAGDGGAAMPDGSWSIGITIPQTSTPGRYTVEPVCLRVNGRAVLATYAPLAFVVTA